MQGLVAEGEETITEGKEEEQVIADLALIVAAQKVEHYEMSGYGSARAIAGQIGSSKVAKLLGETQAEEEKADKLLTEIAQRLMEKAGSLVGAGSTAKL
jgi:Mn-containing catalase